MIAYIPGAFFLRVLLVSLQNITEKVRKSCQKNFMTKVGKSSKSPPKNAE